MGKEFVHGKESQGMRYVNDVKMAQQPKYKSVKSLVNTAFLRRCRDI